MLGSKGDELRRGGHLRLAAACHAVHPVQEAAERACIPRVRRAGSILLHRVLASLRQRAWVGPGGYLSDISRSFVCPGRGVSARQRDLLGYAEDQILHNVGLLRAGVTFREFAERCWPVPERYVHNRYMMMLHGVGLVDEYPSVAYAVDFDAWGYDGTFQENMVVSVESYIGVQGGAEGVKLEEQVLITSSGAIPLSAVPLIADRDA